MYVVHVPGSSQSVVLAANLPPLPGVVGAEAVPTAGRWASRRLLLVPLPAARASVLVTMPRTLVALMPLAIVESLAHSALRSHSREGPFSWEGHRLNPRSGLLQPSTQILYEWLRDFLRERHHQVGTLRDRHMLTKSGLFV
jgi:hypothetical protein